MEKLVFYSGRMVMVTHNDLDAAGCAILAKAAYPHVEIYYENYHTINQRIRDILCTEFDALIIADICPEDPDVLRMLDDRQRGAIIPMIKLFDHHKSAIEKCVGYHWAYVDPGNAYCGCLLLYYWMMETMQPVGKYHSLMGIIDDYDRWQHKHPDSMKMNTLFRVMGMERFIKNRMEECDRPGRVTGPEAMIVDVVAAEEMAYVDKVLANVEILDAIGSGYSRVALIFAERCQSLIGEVARQRKVPADYIAIMNLNSRSVSLRSINPDCDVSEIAKNFGGGGHKDAAGYEIPYGEASKFWEEWI